MAERHAGLVILLGAVLLAALVAGSLMLGRFPIDPGQALLMLADRVVPLEQAWTDQQATLFFNVRMPRIALAALVGASLAAAGAAFQGTFRNPLVSPDVLGASQGAALGAAAALLAGAGAYGVSLWAFELRHGDRRPGDAGERPLARRGPCPHGRARRRHGQQPVPGGRLLREARRRIPTTSFPPSPIGSWAAWRALGRPTSRSRFPLWRSVPASSSRFGGA